MKGIMNSQCSYDVVAARHDFQKLHRHAALRGLFHRLTRRPLTLCPFQAPKGYSLLKGTRRLQEVCLDDVSGSVGRAQAYTNDFLPRQSADEERWARVRLAVDSDMGVPPIELLELNGVYYVEDGHHRVSVFKYLKVRSVEAYVAEFKPMKLSLEEDADHAI